VVGLFFIGAMIYTFSAYARRPPLTSSRPTFLEIDLQGPQHEEGRFIGYRSEKARLDGKQLPLSEEEASQVALSLTQKSGLNINDAADFVAGYHLGISQAQAPPTPSPAPASTPSLAPSVVPQK